MDRGWTDEHTDKHTAIDYSIHTIFKDRHTYTQTVEKTDRRLDDQADSHKERQSNSHYGKTLRLTNRQTVRWTETHAFDWKDRQVLWTDN